MVLFTTMGNVINLPASPGQHCSMGMIPRSTSLPVSTTSWQDAFCELTILGGKAAASRSIGKSLTFSRSEDGGLIFRYLSMSLGIFSISCTPSAIFIRFKLPKALIRTGIFESSTFSKSRAFPPSGCLETRSVISVISKIGDTWSLIRISSFSFSSRSTNSLSEW